MTESHSQFFFKSRQGFQLFIQEWGDPQKPPVFVIHGFPGCSDQAQLLTTSPLANDVRLIAIDRPGYGRSQQQPKITPLSFADQAAQVLDHLGVEQFRILSISGGAPYAYALAALLQGRVLRVASLAGVAPVTAQNFPLLNRQHMKMWWVKKLLPDKVFSYWMHRVFSKGTEKLDEFVFASDEGISPSDQEVFQDQVIGPFLRKTLSTSLSQGPRGILDDLSVYTRPWGIDFQKIQARVTLWHGDEDIVIHPKVSQNMKRYFPKAQVKMVEDVGHYSLPLRFRDSILQDLLLDSAS